MSEFNLKTGEETQIDPTSKLAGSQKSPTEKDNPVKKLIERRHPEYVDQLKHWGFLEDTYNGGRDWFKSNIFRYMKEGDKEFADRLSRAYRFNHTREVVDLLNKYIFKQNIERGVDNAPDSVKNFWEKSTKNGLGIKDLSRQISKKSSIYGRVGIVVDSTMPDHGAISKAEAKKLDVKTYAYIITPQQMLDYAYDDEGNLNWILIEEHIRDDKDPMLSSGEGKIQYRLWTTTYWALYEKIKKAGKKVAYQEVGRGEHSLGIVPVVIADNTISDEDYSSPSLIGDIAYLDRAVGNYLSNLDAIIQDQTFSQLAMPAQNTLAEDDAKTKLLEMGTKRVFLYNGENGAAPFFLSPDPKQAAIILQTVNKIVNEIYHTVGLAGERTKQDNAMGIDNSSGVAKAYDFERVNALLSAKADSLEVVENKIAKIVALWNGEEGDIKGDLVTYPDDFDTRGLYDEFDIAARLMLIEAPDKIRQEQMSMVLDKLFPQIKTSKRDDLEKSLTDWPTDQFTSAQMSMNSAETVSTTIGLDKSNAQGSNQQTKQDQQDSKR